MRMRSLALLLVSLAATVPGHAATIFLKVRAEASEAQTVKLTVRALSRVSTTLPAEPLVYVNQGQGWKERPDLRCRLANTETALRLEADREFTGSCELSIPGSKDLRVRLGYRQGHSLSTSNAVAAPVTGSATFRADQ